MIKHADNGSDEIPDWDTLENFSKSSADFADNRNTRRARKQAIANLKRADGIDAEAGKIVVPRPVDYREMLVADVKTIGDLIEYMEMVHNPQAVIPIEKTQRDDLQREAGLLRGEAAKVLAETADPEIRAKVRDKQGRIADLQRVIGNTESAIAQGKQVQLLHDRIDALVRGRQHDANRSDVSREQQREAIERSLATFPDDSFRRAKQARKSSEKAEKEIVNIQKEIGKLQEQGRRLDSMKRSE